MAPKPKNVHCAITVCLPDDKGLVSRSCGVKVGFKGLWHLGAYLTTVGLRNPHVTPATGNLFQRPCFMGGWGGDGKIAGAEERGLALSVAVFDVDKAMTPAICDKLIRLPYEMLLWTTRSHSETAIHLRLAVAINRPIRTRTELAMMAGYLAGQIGGGIDVANLRNLNHLHDTPLAQRDCHYLEGTLFDVEGLTALGFLIEGTPSHIEPEDYACGDDQSPPRMPGGPEDVLRHYRAIVEKQFTRLETMAKGERSTICTSVGSIAGQAWQGAIEHGVTPEESADEVVLLLQYIVQQRGFADNDTEQFCQTLARQFHGWGASHPIQTMGEISVTEEIRNRILWKKFMKQRRR